MSRKIYFAGSIRGGRSDAALYRRMIDFLKQENTVLTEHVGYLAKEVSHNDREIWQQDTDWIRECDLLIAECTCPSLGVGYELAFAEKLNKPCHVLYNTKKASLSAMLSGDPYFHIHPYDEEKEVLEILGEILNVH